MAGLCQYFVYLKIFAVMNIKISNYQPARIVSQVLWLTKKGTVYLGLGQILCGTSHALVAVWQQDVLFNEYTALKGGFEASAQAGAAVVYNSRNASTTAANSRSYDIFKPSGTSAAGNTIYTNGQDGTSDVTVTSRILDNTNGRWTNVIADKTAEGMRASAFVTQGKSKPGDSAVVAYEFSFNADLGITASDFAVRLSNVNGIGEMYEWCMVTTGTFDGAPFKASDIFNYRNTTYSDLSSGRFLKMDGTLSGNLGSNNLLSNGRSISQFLSGKTGAQTSGGPVQPGWFANDDYHVDFTDGPETSFTNPAAGSPVFHDTLSISGADLGMKDLDPVTTFTVWLGYTDVGFDTNGDGFTSTGSTQRGMISSVRVGVSELVGVPEVSPGLLALVTGLTWTMRRRRQ